MKKLLIIAFFLLCGLSWGQSTQEIKIDLKQVVDKVSTENYSVYQNSLRVYQAKKSITVARMNLLPRLNLWKLASAAAEIFAGGPAGAVGGAFSIVEDIAPFLVPANWFRVSQTKLFYQADQEGYKALWANEILTAKALYHHILLDSSLKDHIFKSQKYLEEIYQIVKVRETFGGLSQSVSQDIKIRLLSLNEDLRALEILISEEESLLAFLMGYPAGTKLKVTPIEMPDYDSLEHLVYEDFDFRAVDVSPEIRQFQYFIDAADYAKKEISYSFLGSSSMSRGLNGGVFDNIPIQAGLGFGTGASIKIAKTQKEILKIQREAVKETVRRQLKQLINNYNLDVDSYQNIKSRVNLTKNSLKQIYQRIQFGENIDSLQLIESSRNLIDAETALFSVMFRFLNSEDKLARLIFYGDYSKSKDALKKIQGKQL
ncbi:MAG: TolC family protein [Bacteriovoracaceae bacterium]|nr:TolC family protein [Bacteriovoracaceae bacterium]